MVEVNEVVAAASGLNDAEFLEVVRAVTTDRPGLASLRAAASGGGGVPMPPVTFPGSASSPEPARSGVGPSTDVPDAVPNPDYTHGGVPTFDSMREKVERRAGTAAGAEELDHESEQGRSVQEQWAAREKAGKARLDEIRRALGT